MGKTLAPCSPENLQYCPDVDTLQDMKAMSIWGNRGMEGAVDLEIRSIRAYGCYTTAGQRRTRCDWFQWWRQR